MQLHFLEEDAPLPAAAGAAAAPPSRIVIDSDEDTADRVCCPMGCGAMVLLEDLDSHEEAHRCADNAQPVWLVGSAACRHWVAGRLNLPPYTCCMQAAGAGVPAAEPAAGAGGGRV